MKNLFKTVAAALVLLPSTAHASLIGQWTFEGPNPLADSTGNFSDLLLRGNASFINGQLDVNGTGAGPTGTPTGWAVTSGGYTGPAITNKTMVSWLTLQSLCPVCKGSALSLDKISADYFDAMTLDNGTDGSPANTWSNNSNGASRFQQFNPGYTETSAGSLIQIAFTYEHLGGGQMAIKGYRNGNLMGSYVTGNASSWSTGDAEVFFGPSAGTASSPIGALDALYQEARIYNTALTQSEVQSLQPVPGPLPVLGAMSGFYASRRLRKRIRAAGGAGASR